MWSFKKYFQLSRDWKMSLLHTVTRKQSISHTEVVVLQEETPWIYTANLHLQGKLPMGTGWEHKVQLHTDLCCSQNTLSAFRPSCWPILYYHTYQSHDFFLSLLRLAKYLLIIVPNHFIHCYKSAVYSMPKIYGRDRKSLLCPPL